MLEVDTQIWGNEKHKEAKCFIGWLCFNGPSITVVVQWTCDKIMMLPAVYSHSILLVYWHLLLSPAAVSQWPCDLMIMMLCFAQWTFCAPMPSWFSMNCGLEGVNYVAESVPPDFKNNTNKFGSLVRKFINLSTNANGPTQSITQQTLSWQDLPLFGSPSICWFATLLLPPHLHSNSHQGSIWLPKGQ